MGVLALPLVLLQALAATALWIRPSEFLVASRDNLLAKLKDAAMMTLLVLCTSVSILLAHPTTKTPTLDLANLVKRPFRSLESKEASALPVVLLPLVAPLMSLPAPPPLRSASSRPVVPVSL